MANPVNLNQVVIPLPTTPLVNEDGTIVDDWYWCIKGLFKRTGGAGGIGDNSLSIANQAMDEANVAANNARAATSQALVAQQSATAVLNTALTAVHTAENALTAANGSASKASNLSDLSSVATARTNLGVDAYPVSLVIPDGFAGTLCIPIVRTMQLDPSRWPVRTYASTPATSNTILTFKKVTAPSGQVNSIGTITLTANSPLGATTAINPVIFNVGDVVMVQVPSNNGTGLGIAILLGLA